MNFISSHLLEIGYGLIMFSGALLFGALYIAVDTYREYKKTMLTPKK